MSPFEVFGARGLLPPAVVWAYCAWLTWSSMVGARGREETSATGASSLALPPAQTADPNQVCNPVPTDSTSTAATVVGMVVASCSLCYTAFAASRSVPGLFSEGGSPAAGASRIRSGSCDRDHDEQAGVAGSDSRLLDAEHGGSAAKYVEAPQHGHGAATQPAATPPPYSALSSVIFLLTLVLASLFSAMVLTNWAVNATDVVTARNGTSE